MAAPASWAKRQFQTVARAEMAVTIQKARLKSVKSGLVRWVASMPTCKETAPTQMPSDSISCWKVA